MSGVSKVEVFESAEELRELMKKQKTPLNYAKVQALYLFKINAVDSIRHNCPEVNGIERVWEYIHTFLEWLIFESVDQLREKLRSILEELNQDIIASLTGWNNILMSLSLAGL